MGVSHFDLGDEARIRSGEEYPGRRLVRALRLAPMYAQEAERASRCRRDSARESGIWFREHSGRPSGERVPEVWSDWYPTSAGDYLTAACVREKHLRSRHHLSPCSRRYRERRAFNALNASENRARVASSTDISEACTAK